MFGIGVQELAVILVLALLIFGPKRLPELARTVGKGLAEFRKASGDLRRTFDLSADPPTYRPPPPPVNADPRTDRDLDTGPAQSIADGEPPAQAALPLDVRSRAAADDDGHGDLALEDDARDRARAEEAQREQEPEEQSRGEKESG